MFKRKRKEKMLCIIVNSLQILLMTSLSSYISPGFSPPSKYYTRFVSGLANDGCWCTVVDFILQQMSRVVWTSRIIIHESCLTVPSSVRQPGLQHQLFLYTWITQINGKIDFSKFWLHGIYVQLTDSSRIMAQALPERLWDLTLRV